MAPTPLSFRTRRPVTRPLARVMAAGLLAAGMLTAGCNDFIGAPSAIANPNNPTQASNNQLLTGVQVNQTALLTGDIARTVGLWMQQFSGTQGQYVSYATYDIAEDFTNGAWGTIYQGGGLQDLRLIQSRADAAGDSTTAGIARVIEGLIVGTAADLWGDIPYTSALSVAEKATRDPQAQVYAAVQTTLDRGITQLRANQGAGPGAADIWYAGNRVRWIEAANTIKARFHLHTAERPGTAPDGTPAFAAAAYQAALAAAQQGISSPANNLRTYQSSSPTEQNLWFQFTVNARNGYLSPSDYFVDLLKSRNDPRLTTYFQPSGGSEIFGSPTDNGAPANTARLNSATVGAAGYRQPLVTYTENQLIIAEAQYRLGNPGAALTAFNNARTAQDLPAATSLQTGAAGLAQIMTEKYIALFQNLEIWNDYKRTCVPALRPLEAAGAGLRIPARFLYPETERTSNSTNIPLPEDQDPRNPNDPNPCSVGGVRTSD
jgi:hypothetical protein